MPDRDLKLAGSEKLNFWRSEQQLARVKQVSNLESREIVVTGK
jgi:hypothetical protein